MSRVLVSDDGGSVRVSEAALVQLVDGAVSAVEGRACASAGGSRVELADGHARAELEISVAYGSVLPEAARAVQENVARRADARCAASRSTPSTSPSWS